MNPTVLQVDKDTVALLVPKEFAEWWQRFLDQKWSGTISASFNRGDLQSWEPKPNLRRHSRLNIPD